MIYPLDWHYAPFVVKWSSNQHQIVTMLEPGHEVTSRLLLQISTGAVSIWESLTAIMRSVIRNCFPHIFVPLEFSARRLSETGMLLAVRLTWRHSERDKLCKARLYCDANRQFHFRNYTKYGTFIVNADFICMWTKNQLPRLPETFMRGFRFRSSFDLRLK